MDIIADAKLILVSNLGRDQLLEDLALDDRHVPLPQELTKMNISDGQEQSFARHTLQPLLHKRSGQAFMQFDSTDSLVF